MKSMEIYTDIVIILVCIVVIGKGAARLVDSAAKIAKRLGILELIIGLTIVAFGTLAPLRHFGRQSHRQRYF
jgi:Ca2+/Na+ antiporter